MTTKPQILDAALDVLCDGRSLTIDAVAQGAKLTKPGVVHHFPTKEALAFAVPPSCRRATGSGGTEPEASACPHRSEFATERLKRQLSQPFCTAHHVGRANGFVR